MKTKDNELGDLLTIFGLMAVMLTVLISIIVTGYLTTH
jgi:hypothetical protein